jgi:hypothetical protein
MGIKKTRVRKTQKKKGKYLQKVFYLTDEQDQYLLNRSVMDTGQANKKSEILRGIIEMAMETDPDYEGGED